MGKIKHEQAAQKSSRRRATGRRRRKPIKAFTLAPVPQSNLSKLRIEDLYRPVKKPITVRIDADVLAWFKKDGKRYQTRINQALRMVMKREMKAAG